MGIKRKNVTKISKLKIDNNLKSRKYLILDLDQTLLHSYTKNEYEKKKKEIKKYDYEKMLSDNKNKVLYYVVKRPGLDNFIKRMASGVPILDTVTKKCKVEKIGRFVFKITLIQGLNRQIRRMCEHLGYEVETLKRERIMNIKLGKLPIGEWRYLNEKELKDLKESLRESLNISEKLRS